MKREKASIGLMVDDTVVMKRWVMCVASTPENRSPHRSRKPWFSSLHPTPLSSTCSGNRLREKPMKTIVRRPSLGILFPRYFC